MGVVLPEWADELLDLIGVSWPNVDEGDYREMAHAMREFADDIDEGANEAHTAIQRLVGSAGGSLAVEALNAHWGKINGTHLKGLADCGRMAGTAMDGVAVLIEGAKLGALVQLGILAAEVIAAQAAAPFTLGLSEVGALGATQATRVIVKRLFKEVCQQVAEQVISIALTPVEEALGAMVGDLVVQLGANALGVQDGVDLSRTDKAGKEGFGQGVGDAKGSAKSAGDKPMQLLSAGGHGGGGGGLGGPGSGGGHGSGGFSFDKDEHDRVVTHLESAGGTFRNKAGGKIGRARGHHGRTRGKDAIADAANVMLDKVIDGIEDGVKKTAKHLDDNMTRGIKQMAKNHQDNDKGLADHFNGLGKGGRKDPKGLNGSGGSGLGSKQGKGGRSPSKTRDQLDKDHPDNSTRTPDSVNSGGSDPVDMASGKMFLPQTDIVLPGALSLVFSRRVESGYRAGRWFGPSWSSTADQRLEIDEQGIIFVSEDGLLLSYVLPEPGQSVLPARGPRRPLTRTPQGDWALYDPETGHTRYFADHAPGVALLDEISDRNGNRITFDYDEAGAPTDIHHSAGYHLRLTTAADRITSLTLAVANAEGSDCELVRYGYTNGDLTEVTDSSGLPLRFAYDDSGRVISWTDSNDRRYDYHYDERDRCIAEGGESGHIALRFAYGETDPETGLATTTATDSDGHITRYLIDDRLQVVAEIDPLGRTTRTERDRCGRPTMVIDPLGRATSFAYDESGRLTAITRPDGSRSSTAYNDRGAPVTITAPDGATWHQEYDAQGNRTAVTDPSGAVTRFTYDRRGHIATVTDALGGTTELQCNEAGLPLAVTDPLSNTTSYRRDAFGRVTSITGPLGETAQFTWSTEGNLVGRTHADGSRETWAYDGEGNCVRHEDATGGITTFEYGHFDQLSARTGPDGVRYEFTHDAHLRLTRVTNPQGLTWDYTYDPVGRLISESDFDGRTMTYAYDPAGQLSSRTNALGQTIRFTYDVLGNVTEKNAAGKVTTYRYDQVGRICQAVGPDATLVYTHDVLGRTISEAVNGRTLSFAYDPLGRRTRRTTPSGSVSTWSYDAAGRRVQHATSGHVFHFTHDASNRETSRALTNGPVLSQSWDSGGRLMAQSLSGRDSSTIQRRQYTYRPDGHLTGIDDHLGGTRTFALDSVGRVTAVSAHGWQETYAYDEAGNQVHADWPDRHPSSEARGERSYSGTRINRAGKVRYEHDAQGRISLRRKTRLSKKPDTWTFDWDAEDHLTQATTPAGDVWRYLYDPLGRRIAKQRLADDRQTVLEQVLFTWDGATLAEQTVVGAGAPASITTVWDYNGLQPIAQTEYKSISDAPQEEIDRRFFAIVTDLVGAPTELIDEAGRISWRARATLWGATTWTNSSTAYTPLRFPGQYFDAETGLHYNVHRYYDPEVARYLAPDPLGLSPAPNPVAYVENPHAWSDPLGLAPYRDLYHGTTRSAAEAIMKSGMDPNFSTRPMDFGRGGFYTTENRTQAEEWASRLAGKSGDSPAILHFRVPADELAGLNSKKFDGPSDELSDFYRHHRNGGPMHSYDTVEGPMLRNLGPFLRKGAEAKITGHQIAAFSPEAAAVLNRGLQGIL
ncbi:RHS repeat-associated core domain-containing protein [Streptomyces sp. DSM 41527]|uniref:RHS repeat-associated core domain-containing protein n=1 Tax=Streptomyces mooreae TaxID=3075523 RepID=A0ABU2TB37_9ACTN|nr:RHS repeat-associated core domain-containing protein [Streptomyces sp. DSM 41527]MDT0458150.1 RHS repeat-associated core domain-containing protein [Streptomyces sp. DSM 41527]